MAIRRFSDNAEPVVWPFHFRYHQTSHKADTGWKIAVLIFHNITEDGLG